MDLGQWISPKFKVRVTSIVMDWMAGLPRHRAFSAYLLEDPSDWQKRFQDVIWQEICRLKGISWKGMSKNRPQWFGGIINDIVYDRIGPPGLREELNQRNPRLPSGERALKHHQLLVEKVGVVELIAYLTAILALMRASGDWRQFMDNLRRAYPKLHEPRPLPF